MPDSPVLSPYYQISLSLATQLSIYQTALSLPLLLYSLSHVTELSKSLYSLSVTTTTVQVTSFSLLLVFPCYQTFTAVLDSPGSVPATISSLLLLPNCPHYQFFSAISINLPLLSDFRCYLRHDSPRSDPVPKSSLSLLLNCSRYQFSTATSLPSQTVLNLNLGDAQHPPKTNQSPFLDSFPNHYQVTNIFVTRLSWLSPTALESVFVTCYLSLAT